MLSLSKHLEVAIEALFQRADRDGKNGILENWNVGNQRLVQPVWVSSASCIFDFFLWPVPHWNAPPVSMLVGLIRSDSLSRVHEASVNYDTKPVCEAD